MAADTKFWWDGEHFRNRTSGEAIPEDEPVILFRARDVHAVKVLSYYHDLVKDEHHIKAVSEKLEEFKAFKRDHPDRIKEPGITRDIRLASDQPASEEGEA